MFPSDLIVETYAGSDEFGSDNFEDPVTLSAQISGRMLSVVGSDGQEHVSRVQATVPGPYGLTAKNRYTLPLEYSLEPWNPDNLGARQPEAIAVAREPDENGPHHETVYF
jgi:hypothetical protein